MCRHPWRGQPWSVGGAPRTGRALPPPGLYTTYTAHLRRDKALLRRLLRGLQKKRPTGVLTALLRRHFLELTQSFIIPLVRPRAGWGAGTLG